MAINPRDIPVTRDMVYKWITGWKIAQSQGSTLTLPQWIEQKVAGLNLPDDKVNTIGHEGLPDEISLAEIICMDLRSYANAPDS